MEIQASQSESVLLIRVAGRMDSVTSPEFERRVSELTGPHTPRVALDLAELEYISSMGLRSLLVFARQVKTAGGELRLDNVEGRIREVFHISGFLQILPIHSSVEEAMAAFG